MPTYTSIGGVSFGDSAGVRCIIPYTASGTLRFGGAATYISTYYVYTASGGLTFSNTVNPATSSSWKYTASGSLSLGSDANVLASFSTPSGGGLNLANSSSATVIFTFAASGGLITGSSGTAVLKFSIGTEFTWDISHGVMRSWRIEAKCRDTSNACPPICNTDPGCPPNSSTMQFVANVQAHSLTELCQKLKNKGMVGPLKKIQMWSNPVNKSDWTASNNQATNTLSTVNFSSVPDCFDFMIDHDLSVTGKVTASLIFIPGEFSHVASGGFGVRGSSGALTNSYVYVASGGLHLGGNAINSSPQYHIYFASGGLTLGGTVNAYGSDYGVLSAVGAVGMTISNLSISFGRSTASTLVVSDDQVGTTCCTELELPQILFVHHELSRSDHLSNFLRVNGLTLPPIIRLMFNQQRNSWYYNRQYRGGSVNQGSQEVWNVIFEFGCLTEDAMIGIPAGVWGFSVMVRRKIDNSRIEVTRLVLEFDPVRVCDLSGSLKFNFTFNTSLLTTNPAVIKTLVFTDEIGSFNGVTYLNNPVASFEVSSSAPNLGAGMFDQSVPFQNMLLSVL